MEKKSRTGDSVFLKLPRMFLIMKTVFISLVCTLNVQANVFSQHTKFDIAMKNVTVSEVLCYLEEISKYRFVYDSDAIDRMQRVDVEMKGTKLETVLESIFVKSGFSFVIEDGVVIIREAGKKQITAGILPQSRKITGRVRDHGGHPLPGVTVVLKGTSVGVVTDVDGHFKMDLPADHETVLVFSFVGMKTQEVYYKGEKELNVVMEEDVKQMDEVVVTGIFSKSKESYTGAVSVITEKELKSFGNRNILTTLRNIDPSFNILESNEWGSNPNRLPEVQIRGAANMPDVDQLQSDTKAELNTPLIIMDGFEITLERMMDLDDSEVETITLLKDASATAIYGSRGANGVIVITTKEPEPGKLRFSYTGSLNLEVPDLSDYDVLNAREKLDLELRSGYYDNVRAEKEVALKQKYNEILQQVERGVNTYWLSKPLRVGIGHRHNIKLEGGDPSFRYSATAQYNDVAGVMKESFRRTFNGGINLSYKTSDLIFRNQLTISLNKAQESPYGTFDEYVKLNPYWTATDENGNIKRFFDEDYEYWGGSYPANPLYNATLNTKETSDYTNITNNFSMEWKPIQEFTLRGTFGIYTQTSNTDNYLPPEHTSFADYTDENYFRRGSYDYSTNKSSRYNFSLTANYSKVFAEKHMVYAGLNMDLEDQRSRGYSFSVEGFPSGSLDFLSVAMQYKENGKPGGSESKSRRVGFVGNASYSFEDRYFVDASFRTDGSSLYGADKRFAPFWSAGAGWNVHNEKFFKHTKISMLKLRYSYGVTGNQEFSAYQAKTMFQFNTDRLYNSGISAALMGYGNPDLEWQNQYQSNYGFDFGYAKDRIRLQFNYYQKKTEGMLTSVSVAPSLGLPSNTFTSNLGKIQNKGVEVNLNAVLIRDQGKDFEWSVMLQAAHNKNKIMEISTALKNINEKNNQDKTTPAAVYEEGESMSAIKAVPSLGIDPTTGQELFMKKDGTITYTWDATDKVICGDSEPKVFGNVGTNLYWKGWNLNMVFKYDLGADYYNSTLAERVEGANPRYNADRRVLNNRWKEPGQHALYKNIKEYTTTYISSRFVQKENTLQLTSLSLSYDLNREWIRKFGLNTMRLSFYMNDVFRASTVKNERGLDYPFQRSFVFGLNIGF